MLAAHHRAPNSRRDANPVQLLQAGRVAIWLGWLVRHAKVHTHIHIHTNAAAGDGGLAAGRLGGLQILLLRDYDRPLGHRP